MTKELIERYLQFAIEHWYDLHKDTESWFFWIGIDLFEFDYHYTEAIPIKDIITSWPFIEAIARGILFNKQDWNSFNKKDFLSSWISDENIIKTITHNQAIVIRDNKLDEFIQDLLPKK
jgi:hypothetical protein